MTRYRDAFSGAATMCSDINSPCASRTVEITEEVLPGGKSASNHSIAPGPADIFTYRQRDRESEMERQRQKETERDRAREACRRRDSERAPPASSPQAPTPSNMSHYQMTVR